MAVKAVSLRDFEPGAPASNGLLGGVSESIAGGWLDGGLQGQKRHKVQLQRMLVSHKSDGHVSRRCCCCPVKALKMIPLSAQRLDRLD